MGTRNRRKGTTTLITHLISHNVSVAVPGSLGGYRWHDSHRYPTYRMGSGHREVVKARQDFCSRIAFIDL